MLPSVEVPAGPFTPLACERCPCCDCLTAREARWWFWAARGDVVAPLRVVDAVADEGLETVFVTRRYHAHRWGRFE